ncbi:uncharacterized protein LOC107435791 isoform X2 [Ziziphus jujuba]|uniref:Uncharacterized protein LOC107435791 isoform X2 n=1 Tax=Ziziphus jujuba TaxID=326968 RepID=A0ABM3ZSL8_ZIZJJ|nr:uncharacterized protein LOC107435791 isoform X2 [Ziziphus jujuba]
MRAQRDIETRNEECWSLLPFCRYIGRPRKCWMLQCLDVCLLQKVGHSLSWFDAPDPFKIKVFYSIYVVLVVLNLWLKKKKKNCNMYAGWWPEKLIWLQTTITFYGQEHSILWCSRKWFGSQPWKG